MALRRPVPGPRVAPQRGVSLVELMVSITVGMILVSGMLAMFIGALGDRNANANVSRLQESARYAVDVLTEDLRLSGYWGLNSNPRLVRKRKGDTVNGELTVLATNDCSAKWYIDLHRPIDGLSNTSAPYDASCLPASLAYRAGTDVLVVRHVDSTPVATAGLQAATVYVRSDFDDSELFIGTTAPGGFSAGATNYALQATAYFVSNFTTTPGDGLPALKRAILSAGPAIVSRNPQDIVLPGVESLQLQFGIDANDDGNINKYVSADEIAPDWELVRAVRIWLLMRAEDAERNYTNTTVYALPDGNFTPNDGFRRLLVSRTVQIRNRY